MEDKAGNTLFIKRNKKQRKVTLVVPNGTIELGYYQIVRLVKKLLKF